MNILWLENDHMKVTNILLWVQENRISEKFYKKLGFDVIKSDDDHSIVRLGNFELVLVSMRDEDEFAHDSMTGVKGSGMYIYIKVDNVIEKHKQLREIGLEPATSPRNWPWGNTEFILKDPDGYKLCFWQKTDTQ
jgi:uncharacterized glyoxalase superfamily protein PhnB